LIAVLVGTGGAIYLFTKNRSVSNVEVLPGNYAPPAELVKLREQAAAGDPDAQLWLSMLLQDSPEGRQWLDRAAASGYPPALHSLASLYMLQGPKEQLEARTLLETAIDKGYYSVISELADCLSEGTCGAKDATEALAWAIVSRNLAGKGKTDGNALHSLESQLRKNLSPEQIKKAEQRAARLESNIALGPKKSAAN
jgi:TPR repeat protein